MKKINLLLLSALLLCMSFVTDAQTVTIGTATTSSYFYGPYYRSSSGSSFNYSRYSYLYTALELGIPSGSIITKIEWYKVSGTITANNDFDIYLENTSATSLSSTAWTSVISGATSVYSSTSQAFPTTGGWEGFTMTSQFIYTGGNLQISTNHRKAGTASGSNNFYYDTQTGKAIGIASSSLSGVTTLGSSSYSNRRPRIRITWVAGSPCSGTPAPGNTVASSNPVCPGTGATLSLQNNTSGTGVSYQWQSSTNGTTYSNISGATGTTYSATPSVSTYYRCNVTCGVNTGTSNPVQLTVNNFLSCYCIPPIGGGSSFDGCQDDDEITNVTMSSINNTTTCTSTSSSVAYTNFSGTVAAPNLNMGSTYNISVSTPGSWTDNIVGWIDFDHSGTFDASEYIFIGTANSTTSTVNTNWTMPLSALPGNTMMRIKLQFSSTPTSSSACAGYTYGECEDYLVNLVCPANVTITTQPTNKTICNGDNTTLTVANTPVTGFTFNYQWQVSTGGSFTNVTNGGVYSGATSPTLAITNATAPMNGYRYNCVITNDCGQFVSSNVCTLTVNTQLAVTSNPTNKTICPNGSTTFNCTATGTLAAYQWQVNTGSGFSNITNGGVYSGATTQTLSLASAPNTMNGYQYRCVVSGACPSINSTTATLNFNTVPAVTLNPSPVEICAGANTSFSCSGTGTGLAYQWQEYNGTVWSNITNGGIYSNATTATLSLTGVPGSHHNYLYRCILSGTCNPSVISNPAQLKIGAPAAITSNPAPLTACSGTSSSMSIAATGFMLTYQWQVSTNGGGLWTNVSNGALYSGVTTNTITFVNTSLALNGYMYRCLATSCGLSATSSAAILSVATSPTITLQPTAKTICANGNTSFSTAATSSSAITYSWQINYGGPWHNLTNNSTFSGVNGTTLTVTNAPANLNGALIRCELFTGCVPATTTNTVLLTVDVQPTILNNPASVTKCEGLNASFVTNATGSNLTYQWEVSANNGSSWSNVSNSSIYAGATTRKLDLTAPPASLSGNLYRCVVSGSCPTPKTSAAATLTVNSNASLTSQTTGTTTICSGDNASFSVSANGTNLTYQWYRYNGSSYVVLNNGGVYSGATSSTLNINGITSTGNGSTNSFYCRISSACAGASSAPVYLIVNAKPVITSHPSNVTVCDSSNNIAFSSSATGTNKAYQWQVNTGSSWVNLSNNSTYNNTTGSTLGISQVLASMNGYLYRCVVSGACTPSVASNSAKLTVNPLLQPSVTISAPSTDICVGESVKFTATHVNGGTPSYVWKKNNVNVATGSTYTSSTFANNDIIYVEMTSSVTCPSPKVVQSNQVAMIVTQNIAPTITITSDEGTSWCSGKPATFRANTTNKGATPTFEWKVNGNTVGTNDSTYTAPFLNDGDVVSCVMTSGIKCTIPKTVTSNSIAMTINLTTKSSIVISPNPDSVACEKAEVVLYPAYTNGGATPAFQWMINGQDIPGQTQGTLKITSLKDGDTVNCRFISSAVCVFPEISNGISFDINKLLSPDVDVAVSYNGDNSYTFTAIPVNGGANPKYQWFRNFKQVAGETSSTYTTSDLAPYDDIYVQMVSSEECVEPSKQKVDSRIVGTGVGEIATGIKNLTLHPNPNTGNFNITGELAQSIGNKEVFVKITNALGQLVYNQVYTAKSNELNLNVKLDDNIANGLYIANIIIGDEATSIRFTLNR